jgi:hypothetical protein
MAAMDPAAPAPITITLGITLPVPVARVGDRSIAGCGASHSAM